jgi:hypothetical protein
MLHACHEIVGRCEISNAPLRSLVSKARDHQHRLAVQAYRRKANRRQQNSYPGSDRPRCRLPAAVSAVSCPGPISPDSERSRMREGACTTIPNETKIAISPSFGRYLRDHVVITVSGLGLRKWHLQQNGWPLVSKMFLAVLGGGLPGALNRKVQGAFF